MKPIGVLRGALIGVSGLALVVVCASACGDGARDSGFEEPAIHFEKDASTDAPDCRLRCSLDGRSVVDGCSGATVETCPPDLACGAAACIEPCAAAAADRSSNGCEFYFQAPRVRKLWPQNCYAAFVVNTSLQAAKLSLELEGKALDLSKAVFRTSAGSSDLTLHEGDVAPGESVVVFLSDRAPGAPPELWEGYRVPCPSGVVAASFTDKVPQTTGFGSSFRLSTNVPVATTTIYPFGGARTELPSATLVLPVATWAKEHMLVNAWEGSDRGAPFVQIVAAEDDTTLRLVPRRDVQDGAGLQGGRAGTTLTYRLAKGQFLQLLQAAELTGSFLTSDKPTSVFGGNSLGFVPVGRETADILSQQIPAYEQWGTEYVGVGYRPRMADEHEPVMYRIVAAKDGTRLDYDPVIPPGAPITMSAGEVVTFQSGTGDAFVVRTQDVEHPVYLAAYMTGHDGYKSYGDPEFVNVVPTGQYSSSYSFYADPTYDETSLVIVRAKTRGAFKDVWLECAETLKGWKPIGQRGEYEFVRVDLQRGGGPGEAFGTSVCRVGLQRMRSEGPFTATLWGWADYASYAYPGGMAHRKLVDAPLLTVH